MIKQGKGVMEPFDPSDLMAAVFAFLFKTPIGWILLLLIVGRMVIDRLAPPRRRMKSRKRRPSVPLYKELLEPLLGGTAFWILLAWGQLTSFQIASPLQAMASAMADQSLLTVILACGWVVAGLSWYFPRWRTRRQAGAGISLEQMAAMPDDEFEELIAQFFRARGNHAEVVGGIGDHGIDIIVTGWDGTRAIVQCKRFGRERWVGEPQVRDLYGTFVHDGEADKAYLITTGFFSDAAREWAQGKPIVLMDGERLARAVGSMGAAG
jgi:HJR/Mrr/RecB family endonuclease